MAPKAGAMVPPNPPTALGVDCAENVEDDGTDSVFFVSSDTGVELPDVAHIGFACAPPELAAVPNAETPLCANAENPLPPPNALVVGVEPRLDCPKAGCPKPDFPKDV